MMQNRINRKEYLLNSTMSPAYILFLIMVTACVLSPALFFGFDVCDTGFYAVFYDRFFSDPDSVSYNFMYWLSGLIGASISAISSGSIFALRVAGLIADILSVLCVCKLFSRFEDSRLSLTLAALTICTGVLFSPLTFYNDILTALLATLSLTLLLQGSPRCILIAGLVAGLNTFSRFPNILDYLFILLLPFINRYKSPNPKKFSFRGGWLWSEGWFAGILAGVLLALSAGHLELLIQSIRELFVIGSTSASESSHGVAALVFAQINSWAGIIYVAFKLALPAFGASEIWKWKRSVRQVNVVVTVIAILFIVMVIVRSDMVTSLAAVSLVGCVSILVIRGDNDLKPIAAAGLLMMFILPLGSDNGIYNAGTIVLWIAAPVSYLFITRTFGKFSTVATTFVLMGVAFITVARGGFYFDDTPLCEMSSSIDAEKSGMIFTSSERARRVNAIVNTVATKVSPGDTLMVYGSAPMINHLTSTRPAIGCSWPELLSASQLRNKLNYTTPIPHIMILKFKTIGSEWGAPSEAFMNGHGEGVNIFHNESKSKALLKYLAENNYKIEAETPDFVLYSK